MPGRVQQALYLQAIPRQRWLARIPHYEKGVEGTAMRAKLLPILAASLLVASVAAAGTVGVTIVITSLPAAHANSLVSSMSSVLPDESIDFRDAVVAVTRADIARGYVDVPAAARLGPRTSAGSVCMLVSGEASEALSEIQVTGLGADTVVRPQSGWACTPSAANSATLELAYRFILSSAARPGTYSWPVSLSIQGL
jgi:hypothetical protein